MDFYTLTENFLAKDVLDEFVSAIWTERYSSVGDVQIVIPATQNNIDKLAEGTFLALRGSKEVMIIETQSIENKLLTIVGKSLPIFLNQRYAWFFNAANAAPDERIKEFVAAAAKPGKFISDIVNLLVINTVTFASSWADANLDWEREELPGLSLGDIDLSGENQRLTFPIGPIYDSIESLAHEHEVGISLYLESADPITGYSLKFKTYQGKDRTSGQTINPLIRLLPELDSLTDLKEIRSNALYKNVIYIYYNGVISKHLAEPDLPEPEGFARRVLVRDAEGQPKATGTTQAFYGSGYGGWGGSWGTTYVTPTDIAAFRNQVAKNAFANSNYIRSIDGQTSPTDDYKYGVHYGLGDIIELEGLTGTLSKVRVTEYIRSEDQNGERNYPTIAVIEPKDTPTP